MQNIRNTETSTGLTIQARELLKTILDAATPLKRLLLGEEFEDSNSIGGIRIPRLIL